MSDQVILDFVPMRDADLFGLVGCGVADGFILHDLSRCIIGATGGLFGCFGATFALAASAIFRSTFVDLARSGQLGPRASHPLWGLLAIGPGNNHHLMPLL